MTVYTTVYKISPTRVPFLGLYKVDNQSWSFCDLTPGQTDPPRRVGPLYPTKAEALVDLPRYALESWGHVI